MDLRSIARALSGAVICGQVHAPGPGHSPSDRSLSIKLSATAPDGFITHSFAGDDPIRCREYVKRLLNLPPGFTPSNTRDHNPSPASSRVRADDARDDNRALALRIWREARDPRGTPVEIYLRNRGLELPEEACGDAIRFHRSCPFGADRFPAMIALVRDIRSNAPLAVQRTALAADGTAIKRNGKTFRMTLGPIAGGAIKLDPDDNVTMGLSIGEGVETALAGRQMGYRPVWSLISTGGVAQFPILPGIDGLTIFAENDPNGASEKAVRVCAQRWLSAGIETLTVWPMSGCDLNDEGRGDDH